MKKKLKLSDLKVSSFRTQLSIQEKKNLQGGDDLTAFCVSGPYVYCFSHDLGTCDCTVDPREFGCGSRL